jgi:hypothetical protein
VGPGSGCETGNRIKAEYRGTQLNGAREINNFERPIEIGHEAAKQLHLPRSWLNESVTIYARRGEGDADRILVGLYPSPERFGLRVTAAKPEYILAMKLKALDRVTADDRDFQDAVGLGIECGVATIDQMHDVYRKFFGSEELPTTAQLRLSGLIEAIRARLR